MYKLISLVAKQINYQHNKLNHNYNGITVMGVKLYNHNPDNLKILATLDTFQTKTLSITQIIHVLFTYIKTTIIYFLLNNKHIAKRKSS